jgi:hypothetical protein
MIGSMLYYKLTLAPGRLPRCYTGKESPDSSMQGTRHNSRVPEQSGKVTGIRKNSGTIPEITG